MYREGRGERERRERDIRGGRKKYIEKGGEREIYREGRGERNI